MARLLQVPLFVWVMVITLTAAGVAYLVLLRRKTRAHPQAEASMRALREMAAAIGSFAAAHQQRLPDTLEELAPGLAATLVYRPVPRRDLDSRLVVAYDRSPNHLLMDFPALRRGRGTLLLSGRTMVLTEEQLEKLLIADNNLRASLGIEPLELETHESSA
jgi:hypothetical protein